MADLLIRNGFAYASDGYHTACLGPTRGKTVAELEETVSGMNVAAEYRAQEDAKQRAFEARGHRTMGQWLFDNGY